MVALVVGNAVFFTQHIHMNHFAYPKGSIWRQWDLQAQTILDDNYISLAAYSEDLKAKKPSDWAAYVALVGGESNALLFDSRDYFLNKTIPEAERCTNYVRNFFAFLKVFNPGLECLGITDHNYFHPLLLDTLLEYSRGAHCKILPGVEINCQGIHLLVYFPGPIYGKESVSLGIHAFLMKQNINNRANADGTLTTTSCDIKGILDEVKRLGGIVIFPHCNSSNGLFQERTKTDRTHLADIFNHQKNNLLQSQNAQAFAALQTYIKSNAALRSQFSCHISSDARSLRDYGRADAHGNHLWIKADPTFEGLKQLAFESPTRLFVGPHRPEQKKSYFVIDKVRFLDNTAPPKFGSDVIEVNQNLTTIVGGKSTGKSLLLHYIAKTIDPAEVSGRLATTPDGSRYDLDKDPNFNFEVIWADGQSTFLKTQQTPQPSESSKRKILYIPQRYLNLLSEANIKSKEALNEFVLRVLLQDKLMASRYDSTMVAIRALGKETSRMLGEVFSEREDISKLEEELKQLGDEKGITSFLQTLQRQLDESKAKSGLTADELKEYEKCALQEKEVTTRIASLKEDKRTIQTLEATLATGISNLMKAVKDSGTYLNTPEIKDGFAREFAALFDSLPANVSGTSAKLVAEIDAALKVCEDTSLQLKATLAPLVAKVQLQSELQQQGEAIKKEQQKLDQLKLRSHALQTKRTGFEKKSEELLQCYASMMSNYQTLQADFKGFESKFGDMSLGVHVNFHNETFNNAVVKEFLNRNDLKRTIEEAQWGEEFVYSYDPSKHLVNMGTVFHGLLGGKISTIKGRTQKDAVAALLTDYFFLDFRIFYKSDSLDKMSPGKKGLVLLQLLINLSDEEWPILLDQPEDDLDNRSVYEDLVSFLKRKKSQRQILIVTHNPNLVVGADSEETIVANQSGQEIGRENKKFQFEYVSGALEHSFKLTAAEESTILFQKGIREHVCEILEGGKEAFQKREQSYNFTE
jgi:hypothetical protein